ncbi:MAG: hypothetical protein P1V35_11480 [Planctomycetota bacterium]|nr:hypothetical protein [Planctomycetota bacterium]
MTDSACSYILTSSLGGPGLNYMSWKNRTNAAVSVTIEAFRFVGATGGGIYDFDLELNPISCPTDAFGSNYDCANAVDLVDGTYLDLWVTDLTGDHFGFHVRAGETVRVGLSHNEAEGNVDGFLRAANSVECGTGYNGGLELLAFARTDNDQESLTWTNSTGVDVDVALEVKLRSALNVDCNTYDLVLHGSGDLGGAAIGPAFCSPWNSNSTGVPTRLSGHWGSGIGSGLHLEVTDGPPTQFGYFIVGSGIAGSGIGISLGRVCFDRSSGHSFGRYNVGSGSMNSTGRFDVLGTLQNAAGTSTGTSGFDVPSTLPIFGLPTISSGSTWHFQVWHREDGGYSNFSNALSVTF